MPKRADNKPAFQPLQYYLLSSLLEAGERYDAGRRRCLKKDFSRKSVHDFRTEGRALLARLELAGALGLLPGANDARKCIKKHLDVTGPLRDLQLQRKLLRGPAQENSLVAELRTNLKKQAKLRLKIARRALRRSARPAFAQLSAASHPRRARDDSFVMTYIRRLLSARFHRVMERQATAATPAEIHKVRVALKQFRYLLEALPADFALLPPRTEERLRDLQSLIGRIHDRALLSDRLNAAGPLTGQWVAGFAQQQSADIRTYRRKIRRLPRIREIVTASLAPQKPREPASARQSA